MQFSLFPWDRNRPRRHLPLADCVVSLNHKTFGLRAQNGMLFFRDQNDPAKTWAIATPLPVEIEDQTQFEAHFQEHYERGNVARFVAATVMLHIFNERTIPLFLRGDGTGFARESWNRDDIEFSHRVSMHDFLEANDELLLASVAEVGRFLENELSQMPFPPDSDAECEWACGSLEELRPAIEWACALEPCLWRIDKVSGVSVDIAAENAFSRAHVRYIALVPDMSGNGDLGITVAPDTDRLEWIGGFIYSSLEDGSQLAREKTTPSFVPSNRFFRVLDIALDQNTPMGLFWQYTDQGAGRCADAPHPPTISLKFARPSNAQTEAARDKLRSWLQNAVPRAEVEEILADDAPRELPKHEWF